MPWKTALFPTDEDTKKQLFNVSEISTRFINVGDLLGFQLSDIGFKCERIVRNPACSENTSLLSGLIQNLSDQIDQR